MEGPPNTPSENDGGKQNNKKEGLTGRTLKNLMWMFAGGSTEAVLKIALVLILARLLTPAEFGVVSAALTVVALAQITGQIGIAPSIIQVKTLTPDHIKTGFLTTLIMGVLLACAFYLLSEPIARLYQMPEVQPLIEVFALLFVIKGAGLVSEALLYRSMMFREVAMLSVLSYIFGYAAVAVTLAVMGYGAWALVWGQLIQALFLTIGYLALARDQIGLGFKWQTFTGMLHFGFGFSLTKLGNYVSQNADFFVVGRMLGAEALGLYSRAYVLLEKPSTLIGQMGDKVLFPTLATIQDDRKRLERALNRALALVAMLQVPLTAFLLVSAPEIIVALLGPQWGAATIPFQILVCVLFFRTAYKFINAILRASGRVYIAAAWQWTYAMAVVTGAFLGVQAGLPGVALGVGVAIVFCYFLGLFVVHRVIGVNTSASLGRLVIYSIVGIALAAFMAGLRYMLLPPGRCRQCCRSPSGEGLLTYSRR
ncbi:MAG: lipopolysaccharide biosynthesis protein [Pseudomonadota bacterium]